VLVARRATVQPRRRLDLPGGLRHPTDELIDGSARECVPADRPSRLQ